MREIKFRAYIKDLKKVVDVREIDLVYKYITFRLDDKAKDEKRTFDQIELMQFTGLYDKNGKEIYEGDIIKHLSGRTIEGKSMYINFCINWGDDNCYRAYKNGLKGYSYEISFANYIYNPKDNEVIGNIYDNPELLKGE